jgi:3-oxoacyl-[acyl-carrier-protein] synthase III
VFRTQIIGTGSYAPEKVITNQDLEKIVETSDSWIFERTGIRARRRAAEDEATSDLAVKASIPALEMAKTRPEELDMIVVGTISPDMPMPACAAFVQQKLGAKRSFAYDVSAACSGSLFGMSIGDQYIRSGSAKRVLVIGAEVLTRVVNWKDRNTCVLFGDAAGAMVLGPSSGDNGILSTHLRTDGAFTDILAIRGGGSKTPVTEDNVAQMLHKVTMNGKEVFKFAVRALVESMKEALDANNLKPSQVDHVVAHQANTRIIDAVMTRLEIPSEKCFLNIERFGNTSAASLPTTLDEVVRTGRIKRGDTVAMMAIGAGMSWGSAILRW